MNCPYPKYVWPNEVEQLVPCGKCVVCLQNKRNDWSFRLEQEQRRSTTSAFVTLTYSEKYVPENGVSKRHLQLFLKRLRKDVGKFRYYAVAEYGSRTNRPHYHLIIFTNGEFKESVVRKAWSTRTGECFGICHIGQVTGASIRYATKYVIQRSGSRSEKLNKPFMLCSRAHGLGSGYLTDEMIKWHRENEANFTWIYGVKGRLPRYYKDIIWPSSDWSNWNYKRKLISDKSKIAAREVQRKNEKILRKKFGKDLERKVAEMRNAVMNRVKEKIAFTQSL